MSKYLHFSVLAFLLVLSFGAQAGPAMTGVQATPKKNLLFIENRGQVANKSDNGIDFMLKAPEVKIYIGGGRIHYKWNHDSYDDNSGSQAPASKKGYKRETYQMDVVLLGANKNAQVIKEEQQAYFENYYLPQCPLGVMVHSYTKVTYKEIYPHIDWVLYSRNNELKYDFVVRPGGNPADIKLRYEGATELSMKNGAVTATTPLGSVTEKKPYSYDAKTKKEIASSFSLKNNTLGFSIARQEGTLVIDPSLAWGTYYGESGEDDEASCLATDNFGNVYMAGRTRSDDEIATPGWETMKEGLYDAYIVKFTTDGQRLWGTYYGGIGEESCEDIINDPQGALYICGTTTSPFGMETPGTQQQQLGGTPAYTDAYLAKFDYNGQRIWGTYYGGSHNDVPRKLCLNIFNTVCIAGRTESPDSISTPFVFQPVHGGGMDAFVALFNGSNGKRQWGTYFGKYFPEEAYSIAANRAGHVYITGYTLEPTDTISTKKIVTPDAYKKDSSETIFVKFDYDGLLLYATVMDTFSGGGTALCVDGDDNVYLLAGALYKIDVFNSVLWYKPAVGYDIKMVMAPEEKIYTLNDIAGSVSRYTIQGVKEWTMKYGGSNLDKLQGFTTDKQGKLYISGYTNSPDSIATPGSFKDTWTGNFLSYDAFLAKFHDTTVFIVPPFTDTLICPPDSFVVNYDVQVTFGATNTFSVQLSDAAGSFANPVNIGSWYSNVAGSITCYIPANTPPGNGYRIRVVGSSPGYISKDNGKNIRILERPKPVLAGTASICEDDSLKLFASSTVAGVSYQWTGPGGFATNTQNPVVANAQQSAGGQYKVIAVAEGCAGADSIQVTVKARPYFTRLTGTDSVCEGSTLKLYAESSMPYGTYHWYGPQNYTSTVQSPELYETKAEQSGRYYAFLIGNNGCNSDTGYVDAEVIKLKPVINTWGVKYPGDTLRLVGESNYSGASFSWAGPNGFTSNLQNPELIDISKDARGTYVLTISYKGCKASTSIDVIVSEQLIFSLYPNPNNGTFTIKGNTEKDQEINIEIVSITGQLIYRDKTTTFHKHFSKTITIPANLANGAYILNMDVEGMKQALPFVIGK
jgi:hypothetical protein